MIYRITLCAILLVSLTALAQAQRQSISAMKIDYDLSGVKFKSSAKFKQRELKNLPINAMLLVNRQREDGAVFVIVPKAGQSLMTALESNRDALAVGLLPDEAPRYQWRLIEKPYVVTAGWFDVDRGQITGFNGQSRLLLEYHLIRFQNREIIVGYLVVADKGEYAARSFQTSAGGGNGSAGEECAVIIRSITGEEEAQVRVGDPPPPAPGSPPPPAPKKP